MIKILRKIGIVLLISVIPAIDGVGADQPARTRPPEPKTKIVCKKVMLPTWAVDDPESDPGEGLQRDCNQ